MLVVICSKHDKVCRYSTTRNVCLMLVVTYSCGPLQCYENELDAYKLNIKNTKATSFRQYKFIFDHEVSSSGLRNSFGVPSTGTEFSKNLQNAVK